MVAEVVDIEEIGNPGELTAVEEPQPKPEATPAPAPVDELPEKYRGKSVIDIVKMHQEAERLASRHAQEVGEVRQLADQLIRSQTAPKPVEPKPEIDFFENPQEAVRRAIENNPAVVSATESARRLAQAESKRQLLQNHPDVGEIMNDPNFAQWVTKSKIRTTLFQQAENYDFDAADELLSTYKEVRAIKKPAEPKQEIVVESEADKAARNQQLSAAAVDTGGSGEVTRKVYRRADLIRLKLTNPVKYDAMQDEIDAAYREDRVR